MISVIIPTYNRAKMVADCVESVLATNYPELEVIVVDDCSPDRTSELLRARFPRETRLKIIRNAKNLMVTGSRNQGRLHASGEYLLFLDHDNIVNNDILVELIACFKRNPQALLVGALTINRRKSGPDTLWSAGNDFNPWTSRPIELYGGMPIEELPPLPEDLPTTYAPNAFMVRRETFDAVKGFDPSIGIMFDESDFGWRVRELGGKGYYATRARTLHLGHVDPLVSETPLRLLGIETPIRAYHFAKNRITFARRHFTFLQFLSVSSLFAPLSALYYGFVALKNRRADVARAYLKGTLAGIFFLDR